MRVLVISGKEAGTLCVMEVTSVMHRADLVNMKVKKEEEKTKPVHGLELVTAEGEVYYLLGLDIIKSNMICKELLEKGFYDLSGAGRICHETDIESKSRKLYK